MDGPAMWLPWLVGSLCRWPCWQIVVAIFIIRIILASATIIAIAAIINIAVTLAIAAVLF